MIDGAHLLLKYTFWSHTASLVCDVCDTQQPVASSLYKKKISHPRVSLPKKHLEVIPEFKVVVEKLQSPLLLQLILITIPKTELDVIYELIHVRQRQDLLKTHLDRDKGDKKTQCSSDSKSQTCTAAPQTGLIWEFMESAVEKLTTKINSNSLSSLYLRLRDSWVNELFPLRSCNVTNINTWHKHTCCCCSNSC